MGTKNRVHLWVLIVTAFSCTVTVQGQQKKPNIVLLFSDDAGYYDFGFQGNSGFPTPYLDAFANESVELDQFYVTAAVCGPSRAGLLTGMYQQRFGYEENNVPGIMSASGLTGDEMGLPVGLNTIADYLKPLGYRSMVIGKWHMGNADRFHPLDRGFDEFYGFRGGARSFWPLDEDQKASRPEDRMERGFGEFEEPERYLTDVFADEACRFIRDNKDHPFFLYLSFNAVHTPLEAKEEDLAMIEGLSGKRKKMAAMTLAMDRACGQVLNQLKELGLDENTLVVFTNDNGGPTDASAANNYPLSGTKANHLEGGIRVPCLVRYPAGLSGRSSYSFPTSTLDLLPTFYAAAGGDPKVLEGSDGVNLLPYLSGEIAERPHDKLFWKKENRGAIRKGDWKLLRFPDRPAELYNIRQDEREEKNLAYDHPDMVRKLYKELFEWELSLERPLWQLKREYEGKAMERMDRYRTHYPEK
ncbi:sulfatase [Echinicola strongylocentroti]|uniref:Sulfatase n=1 Tax=Echinicola strongylocentroti TaxID=1795355 RepID=A0A2Z4IG10_9BACT|nr:sulfatase-like hydrolase/transferase [Echinicola strongylocentroti]AWW29536.1 sulfatase [Echinicola strongylocentroti]